jgi:tetrapyrrole methylase family protein/MazG family protein
MDGPEARPRITVVGLGPAGATYLSETVVALMAAAPATMVRTLRHPAAAQIEGLGVESLDHLYDEADTFDQVYAAIVEELVSTARRHAPVPVVYAVPGSPLVAERTVELLRADPRVDLSVIPSLSFLDLAWERLGIDPLNGGVRLVDAERFAVQAQGGSGPMLVAQCWSQALLSDIKLSAAEEAGADLPDVVLLHHLGLDDERIESVNWWEMDRTLAPDHLTSLFIPHWPAPPADEMGRLEELVHTLREQCPWDRAQTHATLMPHLVEESYEVLDALDGLGAEGGTPGDGYDHLEEELGDLLFQIVFHARLAEEEGRFTLADVARGVHDKLVHRHPHVFGDVDATTAEQVVTNWEAIKKEEKRRSSVTDGIPKSLPALLLSTKLQRKGIAVNLTSPDLDEDAEALAQRVVALAGALGRDGGTVASGGGEADAPLSVEVEATQHLVGDLLFSLANLSRRLGVDPEQALRASALAFKDRIVAFEGE